MVNLKRIVLPAILLFSILSVSFAHEWMAPKKEAAAKNPLKGSGEVVQFGRQLYSDFCAGCHGMDARGLDPIITGLGSRPPDLQKTVKSHSDGDFFWKINEGRNEMPSFKDDLEDNEIWSVIHFIRSMETKF